MKVRKTSLLLFLLLTGQGTLFASGAKENGLPLPLSQQADKISITGSVVDSKGEPLIGVSILEEGTTNGTITDFDGNFSLSVSAGAMIDISYIGYKTQSLAAKPSMGKIVMKEDTEVLDEVVVTALGIKRSEKALSYNVQQVDGDKINTVKDANFISSLNGKVAGVTINSSSTAGGASRVVMRGVKSIATSNQALYVIDGVPMYNMMNGGTEGSIFSQQPGTDGAADINPEDIESISMLTGPSAAALYGNAAAAGVVLITTKKGQEDKTSVTISNNTMFSRVSMLPEMQSKYGNLPNDINSWGPVVNSNYDPKDFFRTVRISSTTYLCLRVTKRTRLISLLRPRIQPTFCRTAVITVITSWSEIPPTS